MSREEGTRPGGDVPSLVGIESNCVGAASVLHM